MRAKNTETEGYIGAHKYVKAEFFPSRNGRATQRAIRHVIANVRGDVKLRKGEYMNRGVYLYILEGSTTLSEFHAAAKAFVDENEDSLEEIMDSKNETDNSDFFDDLNRVCEDEKEKDWNNMRNKGIRDSRRKVAYHIPRETIYPLNVNLNVRRQIIEEMREEYPDLPVRLSFSDFEMYRRNMDVKNVKQFVKRVKADLYHRFNGNSSGTRE